jgi:hydroxymethylglutaryl-CoA lyase
VPNYPEAVRINEDGPREGIQIEQNVVSTEAKIELIDVLSETGLSHIQTVSFVNPRRVPQWADAEQVVAGVSMRKDVKYTGLFLNQMGLDRALATGRLHIEGEVNLCASAAFLAVNQNTTPEKQIQMRREMARTFRNNNIAIDIVGISAAFGCNYQGEISLAKLLSVLASAFSVAEEFNASIATVRLSDTMGWATPNAILRTVEAVRGQYPNLEICLHLHDTRGMAMANAYAGLTAGVTAFDTSIGGLGGCPFAAHKGAAGNLCTEDFVFLCDELGIETGIDIDALLAASNVAERVVGHPLPGAVRRGGVLRSIREGSVS